MDLITHLPCSQGYIVVMMVVDRFSKAVYIGTFHLHFTAFRAASLFLKMVYKHHGFPYSIVSDRDPIIVSHFWKELFKLNGMTLRMSTTYHPQFDG